MSAEIWKPITGFTVRYEVSNRGHVRRLGRMGHDGRGEWNMLPNRAMSTIIDSCGDHVVGLFKGSERVSCKVAHLVASAFLRAPLADEVAGHIDNCKSNNNVENLEWLVAERDRNRRKNTGAGPSRPVVCIPVTGVGVWFPSITKASLEGFSRSAVHRCLTGAQKVYRGLAWRYA